jgi:hypothetical protein
VTERSALRRTQTNDENPGSDNAGKTDDSNSSDTPDLKKEKLGTKTFLPVDIR